jgi:hypothetical protein
MSNKIIFLLGFLTKIRKAFLLYFMRTTCPAHTIFFDLVTGILGEEHKLLSPS